MRRYIHIKYLKLVQLADPQVHANEVRHLLTVLGCILRKPKPSGRLLILEGVAFQFLV